MLNAVQNPGGRRFLKLHLRCRGCQADTFRPMECGATHIVRGRDIALDQALRELIFVCERCPSERAQLMAHTPLWPASTTKASPSAIEAYVEQPR